MVTLKIRKLAEIIMIALITGWAQVDADRSVKRIVPRMWEDITVI